MRYKFAKFELFRICVVIPPTVLIPSCLLLHHCGPMLMKLEVGLPQLIGLASNFNALAQNGHLWTHGSNHWLLIFIRSQCTRMHTVPLVTVTGRTRVTACGLVAQEPYKGSSKNKNKKEKTTHLTWHNTCRPTVPS